ncbi:alkaline phosphatase D family protein [Rhodopirellula sp. JC639]|uniref:alkaline phosphatase D family protein n=1 Tax=Stieleria mannarensis TaxID=2755585 RepID=UPI001602D2CC|nr:alkaline phosphatase D family protein [Rhodopirellula sp. JC639]
MKRRPFLFTLGSLLAAVRGGWVREACARGVERRIRVTLPQAHKGTLEIDTQLLDSYGRLPEDLRQFYLDARQVFESDAAAAFTSPAILDAAARHHLVLMGGPLLGDLTGRGVTLWLRPATTDPITVVVDQKTYPVDSARPGQVARVVVDDLSPGTSCTYQVRCNRDVVAEGRFTTAPDERSGQPFRLTFGSCFHKIGIHNQNLVEAILARHPHAMMLLGDIAVDDRNNQVNMHRADYQLRDVSQAWRDLASQVPLYAAWDDHDYFDNDLSGIPRQFTAADRAKVRNVWRENWNNPPATDSREGIYFNTHVGPVEIIMLDTRSCRDGSRRREYNSYLGGPQLQWLKDTLRRSTAPFKVISSGTMWSDYVSNAKDSWGSWDTQAREEIFGLVEESRIGGVLLVSGDRHGARAFRIPRPSGYNFYEFEPATLGGVSGPKGIVDNCPEQLFGYSGHDRNGNDFVAFGEFTFDVHREQPRVTFRLISEHGVELKKIDLSLQQLTPPSL